MHRRLQSVHGSRHPELLAISQLTDEVCEELSLHMVKEETVLFPYIKQLAASKNNGNPLQKGTFNTVQAPINMMEHEHDVVGKKLEPDKNTQ